jgi:outer membrane protein TolC
MEEALPETTEIPEEFKAAEFVDSGEVDDGWIKTFNDPELEKLVDEAIRNNLNLRIAATQIDAAAAAAVVAGARLKPTVNMGLGATGSGTSSSGSGDAVVGLGTTWEIDVWGKLASGAAAAEASLAATQANYEFGRQSLAAQTAKGWFIATQARMLLNLGLETVDLYQQTLDLVNTKYEVGQVDLLSVLQMQARVVGAQIAMVNIRSDQLITRVNLHLALGGSFEEDPEKRVVEGATQE